MPYQKLVKSVGAKRLFGVTTQQRLCSYQRSSFGTHLSARIILLATIRNFPPKNLHVTLIIQAADSRAFVVSSLQHTPRNPGGGKLEGK